MGQLNGKRVCGRPVDESFRTMVRPNMDGECPEGYSLCDPTTTNKSVDNMVCLQTVGEILAFEERCPILDLVIFKKFETNDAIYDDWVSIELDAVYEIRYTKKGDKLPLSTFEMTVGQPCLDSASQVSSAYSDLEI